MMDYQTKRKTLERDTVREQREASQSMSVKKKTQKVGDHNHGRNNNVSTDKRVPTRQSLFRDFPGMPFTAF